MMANAQGSHGAFVRKTNATVGCPIHSKEETRDYKTRYLLHTPHSHTYKPRSRSPRSQIYKSPPTDLVFSLTSQEIARQEPFTISHLPMPDSSAHPSRALVNPCWPLCCSLLFCFRDALRGSQNSACTRASAYPRLSLQHANQDSSAFEAFITIGVCTREASRPTPYVHACLAQAQGHSPVQSRIQIDRFDKYKLGHCPNFTRKWRSIGDYSPRHETLHAKTPLYCRPVGRPSQTRAFFFIGHFFCCLNKTLSQLHRLLQRAETRESRDPQLCNLLHNAHNEKMHTNASALPAFPFRFSSAFLPSSFVHSRLQACSEVHSLFSPTPAFFPHSLLPSL